MLSYPMTKVQLVDNSGITAVTKATTTFPIYLAAFAAPKGTEDLVATTGNTFNLMYGDNINFSKYGQALLQMDQTAKTGGIILGKRIVASDATLANLIILANISVKQVQKTDADGKLLYKDAVTSAETINATSVDGTGATVNNTAIMIDKAVLKITAESKTDIKNISELEDTLSTYQKIDDTAKTYTYPLWVITDNGRGTSLKGIEISPDYTNSKYSDYMLYTLYVVEDNTKLETLQFTLPTDIIKNGENLSLDSVIRGNSGQLNCRQLDDSIELFIDKVTSLTGMTRADLISNDILFCKNKKAQDLSSIELDLTSDKAINLSYLYGLQLQNGDDGAFKDGILSNPEYEKQLGNFFDGTFTNDIYDLDNYKIDLVMDANYPDSVKRKIEQLANFRGDFLYFRDLGTSCKSIQDIKDVIQTCSKDIYSMTSHLAYDIIDPYSRKQITVTYTYRMSQLLVQHFIDGRNRPMAGQLYGFYFDDAIKGTVNFIPRVTPSYDEKDEITDLRCNYASYYDGRLVMETEYTSQDTLTQLSYGNNILAIQQVVKALRTKCPKTRYNFNEGDSLSRYENDVESELSKYVLNFGTLKFKYIQDTTMKQNKIFYAAVYAICKDFIQSEFFKIIAVNSTDQIPSDNTLI